MARTHTIDFKGKHDTTVHFKEQRPCDISPWTGTEYKAKHPHKCKNNCL